MYAEMPELGKDVRRYLNQLNRDDLDWDFKHEIIEYGIDAVASVHLIKRAKEILHDENDLLSFIEKFDLYFGDDIRPYMRFKDREWGPEGGFVGHRRAIANDGVYIPSCGYLERWERNGETEQEIEYFNGDLRNRTSSASFEGSEDEGEEFYDDWKPEDLLDQKRMDKGLEFQVKLWRLSKKLCEDRVEDKDFLKKVKPLIDYYDQIVNL